MTRCARPCGAALRAFCALRACPAFAGMTMELGVPALCAPTRGKRTASQHRGFDGQCVQRKQGAIGLGQHREQGTAAQADTNPKQAAAQVSIAQPLAAMQPGHQTKQDEGGRQHRLTLHDVQRGGHEEWMQQPQGGAEQGRQVDAPGQCRIARNPDRHTVRRGRHRPWIRPAACRVPSPRGRPVPTSGISVQRAAKPRQQLREQRAIHQVQDQAGALEREGISRPVVPIEQEAQQGERTAKRIVEAGGDVAPERRPVVDRPAVAQGRQVGKVIEQEAAVQTRPVGGERQRRACAGSRGEDGGGTLAHGSAYPEKRRAAQGGPSTTWL